MEYPGAQEPGRTGMSMPPMQIADHQDDGPDAASTAYLARVQRLRARRESIWEGFPIGSPQPFDTVVPYSFDGGGK